MILLDVADRWELRWLPQAMVQTEKGKNQRMDDGPASQGCAGGRVTPSPSMPLEPKTPTGSASRPMRAAGIFFRSAFIIVLLVVVSRVSAPQQLRSNWFDLSSGDFIRAALGLGFSIWMLVHLF